MLADGKLGLGRARAATLGLAFFLLAFFLLGFFRLALSSAQAEELCVQLKWHHQSQFAGFYLAEDAGHYRERGLTVRLLEGGPGIDWQRKMDDPSCPIGVTNAYEIVIARQRGAQVKAIAAIDQVSPIVWFSLKQSGIRDPRDFKGKKVVLVPTGVIHLKGMLGAVGLNEKDIKIEPFSLDLSRLYSGEVDVWSGYVTNLVTKAEAEGRPVNVIHPVNYGVQIYDDVIYAQEGLIRENPELVFRFLDAALRGWADAVRDPALAVRATLGHMRDGDRAHETALFLRTIPYVHTGELPVGWMAEGVWADVRDLTCAAKGYRKCPEAGSLYTDEFLRRIYSGQGSGQGPGQ